MIKLKSFLERLHEFFLQHSRVTTAVTLVCLVFSFLGIRQLKYDFDLYHSKIKLQSVEDLRAFTKDSETKDKFFVFFRKPSGAFTFREYCQIYRGIKQQVATHLPLAQVLSPSDILKYQKFDQKILLAPAFGYGCDKVQVDDQTLPLSDTGPYSTLFGNETSKDLFFQVKSTEVFSSDELQDIMTKIRNEFSDLSLKVHFQGAGISKLYIEKTMVDDIYLNFLVLILLVILPWILFRSWRAGLLVMTSLLACGMLTFSLMGWAAVPIDLLGSSLFLLICVSCLEDILFIINGVQSGLSWRLAFKNYLLASFMTSVTTIIGFWSLLGSDLTSLQRFGFWGGVGAIIEWILVFLILPSFLSQLLDKKDFLRIKEKTSTQVWNPKWSLVRFGRLASIVFFILFAIGTSRIQVQETPDKNFRLSHEYSQTIQYLQETRHWKGHFYLQFKSLTIHDEILKKILSLPNVTATIDPRDILEYTLKEVPVSLKHVLEEGIISAKAFKEFNVHGQTTLPIFVKEIDTKSLQKLFAAIKDICNYECKSVGELVIYSDFANIILKSLYESMGLSLILIFTIIFMLSGNLNWRERATICFSILLCPVGLLGIIGWGGFEMNLTFSIVGGIFLGIAGDNAIQFILSNNGTSLADSINEKRGGSSAMSLMGGIISAILVLNSYQPLSKMALLLVFGFILLYIGDVFVLQMWLRRK